MRIETTLIFVPFFCLLASCIRRNEKNDESYISGNTKIVADESFRPIIEDELYIFENTYTTAKLNITYQPENSLLRQLLNDSVKVVVMSRKLNSNESRTFKKKNIKIRTTRFATDGIALITHRSNLDSTVTVQEIINIMQGEKGVKIKGLVFDNPNSGTVRYLMDLAHVKLLPKEGVYALKSNPEVIKYVYNNPGTIGVIGVNWMEQPDVALEKQVAELKIMGVKNLPGNIGSDNFYQPDQTNLALGLYPLTRDLFIINCQGGPGLGNGFASFLAGEQGQRIVLKSGLLPDKIPPREVIIRKKISK